MTFIIRPAGREDILRQFRYYLLEAAPDTATRFLDAVDESINAICAMPNIGAPKPLKNPTLSGLRFWPVNGFENILIFYLVQPETLRVVRILHGKRDIKDILERESSDEAPN